jgi:tocopherol cyclase
MLLQRFKSVFNPDMYQGHSKRSSYFEGWYFKLANPDADKIFAIIPGISMEKDGRKHAFIQVLDGIKAKAEYYKFDFNEFKASSDRFGISIADNHFTENNMSLNLPDISGKLEFTGLNRWPNRWYSPGIMGPYTFVPFMECYHGIISMDHKIDGQLSFKKDNIDFSGGSAYTEKDWGQSFPEAYIWMQSNHFSISGISLKVSIARIPWLGRSFTGFIAGVLCGGKLYEFTTYNSSKLKKLEVSLNDLAIQIENKKYSLNIMARRENATLLASPVSGEMSGHISESMTSIVEITLSDIKSAKIIYTGRGANTALEVAGDVDLLM